jgi:hypothetical protein
MDMSDKLHAPAAFNPEEWSHEHFIVELAASQGRYGRVGEEQISTRSGNRTRL